MTAVEEATVRDNPVTGREQPFVSRVRLRARRRSRWMRSLWMREGLGNESGLVITHAEVDRLLTDPDQAAADESNFYETDAESRELTKVIHQADEDHAKDPAWNCFRTRFGLSEYEIDLLAICVAVEVAPQLRRVYAYLQDDASAGFATLGLASSLFQWPQGVSVSPQSPIVRWLIARPPEGSSNPWTAGAPWIVDSHIVLWAADTSALDPLLGTAVELFTASRFADLPCLFPRQFASIRESMGRAEGTQFNLVGTKGSGKQTLAGQISAALGHNLVCADAGLLLGSEVPFLLAFERGIRAARLAHLAGAFLYWQNAEAANAKVWSVILRCSPPVFLSSQNALSPELDTGAVRILVEQPPLSQSGRVILWSRSTAQAPPASLESLLSPAEIIRAARRAEAGTEQPPETIGVEVEKTELFAPLICPYTWDDIVLPGYLREHLQELEQQVRLRQHVYEDWGFGRLCPMGRGITAMFAGPSGTGKTMAAQVIAASLGMTLFRVDLAGVVNKYIGETEKRLRQVFDACERANVILFFDEADALFGTRTQVKDAHDRFANIEIDYLLQRVEQFNGVAFLATNRKGDLDKAFLRRIRFMIDFIPPGPAERLAMWQKVLHARTPGGEELLYSIDWCYLSQNLTLTGADIRGAALSAAFLARAEGALIGMRHILHAAQREITKNGVALRLDAWGGK